MWNVGWLLIWVGAAQIWGRPEEKEERERVSAVEGRGGGVVGACRREKDGVEVDPEIGDSSICANGADDGSGDNGGSHRSELQLISELGVAQAGFRQHGVGSPCAQLLCHCWALQPLVMGHLWRNGRKQLTGGVSSWCHCWWSCWWLHPSLESCQAHQVLLWVSSLSSVSSLVVSTHHPCVGFPQIPIILAFLGFPQIPWSPSLRMRFSILEIFVSAAAAALQNFVFCHWNSQRILFIFLRFFVYWWVGLCSLFWGLMGSEDEAERGAALFAKPQTHTGAVSQIALLWFPFCNLPLLCHGCCFVERLGSHLYFAPLLIVITQWNVNWFGNGISLTSSGEERRSTQNE